MGFSEGEYYVLNGQSVCSMCRRGKGSATRELRILSLELILIRVTTSEN